MNVEFHNEFLEGITSYLKSCNQLNFLVTRHFELVTRYAKIEFPGSVTTLIWNVLKYWECASCSPTSVVHSTESIHNWHQAMKFL